MSNHMNKGAVPKFTSFKPKVVENNHASQVDDRTDVAAENPGPRRNSRHLKPHHERVKDLESRHTQSTSGGRKSVHLQGGAQSCDEPFVVDTLGDFKNLIYGSVHRYDVPPFHRAGGSKVLGAHHMLRIKKDHADADGVVRLGHDDEAILSRRERYMSSKNLRKTSRLIVPGPYVRDTDAVAASADFVPLSSSAFEKRRRSSLPSSGEEEQQYRSVEGRAPINSNSCDTMDGHYAAMDSSSDGETGRRHFRHEDAARSLRAKLSKDVDARPSDIEAWMALIHHQDALLSHSADRSRKITAAERRSVADLKIHLYERALKNASPSLENRERLLTGLMEEGAKVWDYKVQSERWNRLSEENIDSLKLWKLYVDFRQSSLSTFKYDEVRDIYKSRIHLLRKKIASVSSSSEDSSLYLEHLIYTALRATIFMQEAGYSEVATAIWQAILELNFCSPDLKNTLKLSALAGFWESECPRIGEAGGIGWKGLQGPNHNHGTPESRTDQALKTSMNTTSDAFEDWTTSELSRAVASYLPARTMDDVVENDPYRVILWSDIEGFIFEIPEIDSNSSLKGMLLGAFTLFCRLPPMCGVSSTCAQSIRRWWSDSFIRGDLLECYKFARKSQLNWANRLHGEQLQSGMQYNPTGLFSSVCQLCPPSTSSYIGAAGFASPFISLGIPIPELSGPGEKVMRDAAQTEADMQDVAWKAATLSWCQDVLRTLTKYDTSIELAEYCLAIQLYIDPQKSKKTAKGFLRASPTAFELYNAYALTELAQGHHQTACSVIEAALAMTKDMREEDRYQSILLWKTWLWMLLEQRDLQTARCCLLAIPSHDTSLVARYDHSPTSILRARRHISSSRDFLLSTNKPIYAGAFAECLALLEYLEPTMGTTSQAGKGDLESALEDFLVSSKSLVARHLAKHQAHELLLQASGRLIMHHVQQGLFRPGKIREHLSRCLSYFPDNTNILSIYAWNESRMRIDDRVRTLLRDTAFNPSVDCVTTRVFAIQHEQRFGNVHSIRASFENAVKSPECRSNPDLWRLYILFCLKTHEYVEESKAVFYRAMRSCPWAKRLHIMAFEEKDLRHLFSFEELKAIYRVLGEKELRIHVDLEDFLEQLETR